MKRQLKKRRGEYAIVNGMIGLWIIGMVVEVIVSGIVVILLWLLMGIGLWGLLYLKSN